MQSRQLADRTDCAARRILGESIVVFLPIQNPDGREADSRRNAYGARYTVQRSPGRVGFVIANPGERIGDEHPYARDLDASLREADVPVVLYRVP